MLLPLRNSLAPLTLPRVVAAAGGGGTYPSVVLADSPVAYWRLGEASGTAAADASGNGKTGTYHGGVTLGQSGAIAGDSDTSVEINGFGQYVLLPLISASTNVSVEAWIKPLAIGSTGLIVCNDNGSGSTDRIWQLQFTAAGAISFIPFSSGTSLGIATSSAIGTGSWHHVVGTWDGTTVRIYLDGSLSASTGFSGTATNVPTADASIGASTGGNAGSAGFVGDIDEVAIYGTALSATRILAHYNAGI